MEDNPVYFKEKNVNNKKVRRKQTSFVGVFFFLVCFSVANLLLWNMTFLCLLGDVNTTFKAQEEEYLLSSKVVFSN